MTASNLTRKPWRPEVSSDLVITPTAPKIGGLPVLSASARALYMNILVYGDSGVGKTRLLGSADEVPELRKVLVLDAEGGTLTLRDTYPNVEVVRVNSWKKVIEVLTELENVDHDYQTLVVDSLGELQQYNMYGVLADPNRKSERDADVADMHDWGKNLVQMKRFVRRVRDLPMHTFFTCLTQEDKDVKSGKILKKPGLPGKLRNEVAAFLDIVFYMYMKEVEDPADPEKKIQQRMILTGATDQFIAKDRTNKLPMIMQMPTMKQIWEITHTRETNNV
jgi:hypothetical protein